eukprot:767549-Hanusia_phi.AAC.1
MPPPCRPSPHSPCSRSTRAIAGHTPSSALPSRLGLGHRKQLEAGRGEERARRSRRTTRPASRDTESLRSLMVRQEECERGWGSEERTGEGYSGKAGGEVRNRGRGSRDRGRRIRKQEG